MKKLLIQQARQSNLADFLLSKGVSLKRDGNGRYRSREHSSLVFTQNSYYWNSTGETGNSVDYLTKHMGYSFTAAVKALTDEYEKTSFVASTATKDVYDKSSLNRAYAYLCKTRYIDNHIVQDLVNNNKLLMHNSNNIAFVMVDEDGDVVGYELQGTLTDKRYKGISKDSKFGYGFSYAIGVAVSIERLFVFESAIDLLSFYEIYQHRLKEGDLLLSMGGLKEATLKHYKVLYVPSKTFVCTDNDAASSKFKDMLKNEDIAFIEVLPKSKDWNQDLQDRKKKKE